MWPALFALTNAIAVAGWLALLIAPRREATLGVVLNLAVAALCLAYLAMFVALFGQLADPVRVAGAPRPDLADYSIAGIRGLFMSDGGIVLGWTHYLAFDLFVGIWIVRDGIGRGASRLAQAPFLLATFLAGPIGLGGWLAMRRGYHDGAAPRTDGPGR